MTCFVVSFKRIILKGMKENLLPCKYETKEHNKLTIALFHVEK